MTFINYKMVFKEKEWDRKENYNNIFTSFGKFHNTIFPYK